MCVSSCTIDRPLPWSRARNTWWNRGCFPWPASMGLPSVRELVTQLRAGPIGDVHVQVIEAMTTNETSFFRDLHPFNALRKDVLPPLLAARAAQNH